MKVPARRRSVLWRFALLVAFALLSAVAIVFDSARRNAPCPGPHLPNPPVSFTHVVRGRLVRPETGAAAASVSVAAELGTAHRQTRWRATTDASGLFVFSNLPAGPVALFATEDGAQVLWMPEAGRLRGQGGVLDLGDLELAERTDLRVRLLDASGEPLAREALRLERIHGTTRLTDFDWLATDALGEGVFDRIPSGRYAIVHGPEDGRHERWGIDLPVEEWRVVELRAGSADDSRSIEVSFVDHAARDCGPERVRVEAADRTWGVWGLPCDGSGRIRTRGFIDGAALVTVLGNDGRPSLELEIDPDPGGDYRLELAVPSASIEGRVPHPDCSRWLVHAFLEEPAGRYGEGVRSVRADRSLQANKRGKWRMSGMPAGRYAVYTVPDVAPLFPREQAAFDELVDAGCALKEVVVVGEGGRAQVLFELGPPR